MRCEVTDKKVITPFKVSKANAPIQLLNKQNILNSLDDKKFFEDLENIEQTSKMVYQSGQKVKLTKKKGTARANQMGSKVTKSINGCKNYSQDGNAALSFKSMTSYILGDLDISEDDDSLKQSNSESNSFEISSNSSSQKSIDAHLKNEAF